MCFYGSSLQLPGPCFHRDRGRILQHIPCVALWKCSASPRSQPTLLACLARLTIWQLSARFHIFLPSMEVISFPANCHGDIMSTSRGSCSSPDAGGNGLAMIQKCSPSLRKERSWVKIPTRHLSGGCGMFTPREQMLHAPVKTACPGCALWPWAAVIDKLNGREKGNFDNAVNLVLSWIPILEQRELKLKSYLPSSHFRGSLEHSNVTVNKLIHVCCWTNLH